MLFIYTISNIIIKIVLITLLLNLFITYFNVKLRNYCSQTQQLILGYRFLMLDVLFNIYIYYIFYYYFLLEQT